MHPKNLLIIGGSGHAKVVIDAARSSGRVLVGFLDDNETIKEVSQLSNLGKVENVTLYKDKYKVVIGIGNNAVRSKISSLFELDYEIVVDATAIISSSVSIGVGTVVLHGAIVQSGTLVGNHCIINTKASVDHDCSIGNFVHISPGATICGTVNIGSFTQVGAGATIINNLSIGQNCIIGAGAVVTRDIPDHAVAVGVPAKIIKYLQ